MLTGSDRNGKATFRKGVGSSPIITPNMLSMDVNDDLLYPASL